MSDLSYRRNISYLIASQCVFIDTVVFGTKTYVLTRTKQMRAK